VKVLLQRVSQASVRVEGRLVSEIGAGLLVLIGIERGDTAADAEWFAERTAGLRIFDDEAGRMNRSLLESGGAALVVSQFTLAAATRRGRRPSWDGAAESEVAQPLCDTYIQALERAGVPVRTGRFGARMQVALSNEGPVTILLDPKGDE